MTNQDEDDLQKELDMLTEAAQERHTDEIPELPDAGTSKLPELPINTIQDKEESEKTSERRKIAEDPIAA